MVIGSHQRVNNGQTNSKKIQARIRKLRNWKEKKSNQMKKLYILTRLQTKSLTQHDFKTQVEKPQIKNI